jgi:hypothetical protein
MIGRKVFVRYTEVGTDNVENSKESSGEVVDKILVSIVHNGDVVSNDNYLIRKEDGTCLVLHPSCILKID